jgi:hypothetical protein
MEKSSSLFHLFFSFVLLAYFTAENREAEEHQRISSLTLPIAIGTRVLSG